MIGYNFGWNYRIVEALRMMNFVNQLYLQAVKA